MSDLVQVINEATCSANCKPPNSRDNANEGTSEPKQKLNPALSSNSVSHTQEDCQSVTVIIDDSSPQNGSPNPSGSHSHMAGGSISKLSKLSWLVPMSRKMSQIVPTTEANTVEMDKLENCDKIENGAPRDCHVIVKNGSSIESLEDVCRICQDNPSRMTLLSPCLCKGSMGKVHRVCLERWLGESAKTDCEICGHEYETERRPKYTGWRSVVAWIRNPLAPTDTRNLFFDLACFFILTPLAAISAWLCVVGAKHYQFGNATLNAEVGSEFIHPQHSPSDLKTGRLHHKFPSKRVEPVNSTWTSIGLLTLTGTLLAAYYVWLFVAVRYHIQVWREWQARNFVVTISPSNPERIRQLREAVVVGSGLGVVADENHRNHQPEVIIRE